MKTIDEKLMIIGLFVDIESKINEIEFRFPTIIFWFKIGAPIKSTSQRDVDLTGALEVKYSCVMTTYDVCVETCY